MYTETIPQMLKMLQNLDGILQKLQVHAEEKKLDLNFLLNDRLYPDQFNFTRQVQIISDNAKGLAARLAGQEAPKYEDQEKTIPELKARLEKTIDYLKSFRPENFQNWTERQIILPFYPGRYMTGFEYLYQYALPNFYFHFATAYSILRHNGIAVGKSDYLGALPFKNL